MQKSKNVKAKKVAKAEEEPTYILLIADRSGSMASVIDDAIGGCNTFIEKQKKVKGKAYITIVEFDHEYIVRYNGVDIQEVKSYDRSTYVPRGTTALYDAVGRGMSDVAARLKECVCPTCGGPRLDRKVIVAVMTDGMENSSTEFSGEKVRELVNSKKESGWEILYLSAGLDAVTSTAQANFMGINSDRICCRSISEVQGGWNCLDTAVTSYRTTGTVSNDWQNQ